MKIRGALALSALAVTASLALASALAETKTLVRSGPWEAFDGTTSKGNPICGMSTEVDTNYFGIKRIGSDGTITIQLGTGRWKLTDGQKMGLNMIFDANPVWRATGTGMHFDDGDPGLEFIINQTETENFMREFRQSAWLVVKFPDGNFADWKLSLSGSSTVNDAFVRCARRL